MSVLKAKIGGVLAAVVTATAVIGLPGAASAQGLIEFLWGGEPEYGGGKRQMVTFNSQYKTGQIIVSFGDRRLYHITAPGKAMSYPIAIPREQSRWQGNTVVSMKRENPDWRPTAEMLRENPKLPSWVPGGHPMNPLGVRALYLGSSTYRIHGTDAPWTIGQNVSKGCIRMFNEDVIHLYPKVPTGTKVVVTWERFKTSASGDAVAEAPVESEPAKATEAAAAPEETEKPKIKNRSVTSTPPKPGFVVYSDDNANAAEEDADPSVQPEEGMTVYSRNADGTYTAEEANSEEKAPEQEVVTRRKTSGKVSHAAQTTVE
ncbi:MAG TPA: L,D-transpeptidase [Hyphomicrobium sp.]|nr:L,D-transpeptidase [Hyphomicrobium sp.]